MRIIALVFGIWILGAGSAVAFDCANATLPSSIVICSDPELQRLADERQAAFNEARARLNPVQFENRRFLFRIEVAKKRFTAPSTGSGGTPRAREGHDGTSDNRQ
ncbi:MAG TPA: hypothetical protein VJ770_29245, partial [Stellaceae bacterium]|nr:hypothetical protein [Stellaceae bacterium]